GRVLLDDKEITKWPMFKRSRDGGMGYLAQEQSVFRKLTVQQNLLAIMELIGMPAKERRRRSEELMEQFDITRIRKSKAHYISGGEKRRLEIARCLVTEPRIILLDEPFTGIDPVTIHSIQKIIMGLRDDGISILITDHRERETLAITDRSYIVRAG
ncbi:MAG TPA: LPS export ABC transporter ATP-binding protein, partial [Planctomycetaceae bacterium]|nr:LPS export ABC transporter ATP-binding protein [Planctomycetaceae bacterium]